MSGPRRRVDDHVHPEYWTEIDHIRFEDRVSKEIHELRSEVKGLTSRLTYLLGGIGVLIFVVNIAVTLWIRLSL